jgi:hypothetical protein
MIINDELGRMFQANDYHLFPYAVLEYLTMFIITITKFWPVMPTPMREAVGSSETLLLIYQNTRLHTKPAGIAVADYTFIRELQLSNFVAEHINVTHRICVGVSKTADNLRKRPIIEFHTYLIKRRKSNHSTATFYD